MRARGDRTLVYGMQSSGATLVALLLAQRPDSIALLDVFCGRRAPSAEAFPADRPTIVKATISSELDLADHVESFRPTSSVLVVRHPAHVFVSLTKKRYARMGGTPDDKLRRFEATFRDRHAFDVVVRYEDLVFRPDRVLADLGTVDPNMRTAMIGFPRSAHEIVAAARDVPALAALYTSTWDKGNADGRGLDHTRVFKRIPSDVRRHVESLCPSSTDYFDRYYDEAFPAWRVTLGGWWGDAIYPRVRTGARTTRNVARRAVHTGRR